MENKQMIDGVDVSGCEYYNKDDKTCREINGKYDIDTCDFDKCENSNCHYKNWQRKEQENERSKSELQAKELELIMAKADLCRGCQYKNDYKAKQQECEELRHKVELMMDCASCKVDEYKQTLVEIKEIIKQGVKIHDDIIVSKQILQKVSKVI